MLLDATERLVERVHCDTLLLNSQLAAIVRDIIYLDGGSLFWQPRMEDGSPQAPKDNGMSIQALE